MCRFLVEQWIFAASMLLMTDSWTGLVVFCFGGARCWFKRFSGAFLPMPQAWARCPTETGLTSACHFLKNPLHPRLSCEFFAFAKHPFSSLASSRDKLWKRVPILLPLCVHSSLWLSRLCLDCLCALTQECCAWPLAVVVQWASAACSLSRDSLAPFAVAHVCLPHKG